METTPFPIGKYDVIYIDPPWEYKNKNPPCLPYKKPETCSVEYYYPILDKEEIKKLPINELAKKNCVLFLWATTPTIQEAFELIQEWGFRYKTMITWEKEDKDCMGYWFRVCTEHLIIAIKGSIKAFRSMERTCYHSKRGTHSKKPSYFYNLIEAITKGNRIELFARERRNGWDAWGNELDGKMQTLIKGANPEGEKHERDK